MGSLVAPSPNAMPLPCSETPHITPDWRISSPSASLFLACEDAKGMGLSPPRCDRIHNRIKILFTHFTWSCLSALRQNSSWMVGCDISGSPASVETHTWNITKHMQLTAPDSKGQVASHTSSHSTSLDTSCLGEFNEQQTVKWPMKSGLAA